METNQYKSASTRDQVAQYQPSEAQCAAGNYPKLHLKIQGMPISIENPAGSYRSGTSPDGTEWKTKMYSDYGYIKRTVGADAPDQIDVFLGPKARWTPVVHVIDQVDPSGEFDEHKCMVGWDTQSEAKKAYLKCYDKGWTGCGAITTISINDFKKWIKRENKEALSPLLKSASTTWSKEFLSVLVK